MHSNGLQIIFCYFQNDNDKNGKTTQTIIKQKRFCQYFPQMCIAHGIFGTYDIFGKKVQIANDIKVTKIRVLEYPLLLINVKKHVPGAQKQRKRGVYFNLSSLFVGESFEVFKYLVKYRFSPYLMLWQSLRNNNAMV